ncbi:hypothetical protein [Desulfovibrio sp. ZJ200]|uniref:hypothetical protein n=1 Tax=Desulfovibrio sp. ZJ200 TaxID=2709792 RepID=UPI0013EC5C04|nr:hypothetical protein [Desulfovibrio sp. ZJ200]
MRKRQPPQRGVHSGENRVFRLNATFDFYKKSKVICSKIALFQDRAISRNFPTKRHGPGSSIGRSCGPCRFEVLSAATLTAHVPSMFRALPETACQKAGTWIKKCR